MSSACQIGVGKTYFIFMSSQDVVKITFSTISLISCSFALLYRLVDSCWKQGSRRNIILSDSVTVSDDFNHAGSLFTVLLAAILSLVLVLTTNSSTYTNLQIFVLISCSGSALMYINMKVSPSWKRFLVIGSLIGILSLIAAFTIGEAVKIIPYLFITVPSDSLQQFVSLHCPILLFNILAVPIIASHSSHPTRSFVTQLDAHKVYGWILASVKYILLSLNNTSYELLSTSGGSYGAY